MYHSSESDKDSEDDLPLAERMLENIASNPSTANEAVVDITNNISTTSLEAEMDEENTAQIERKQGRFSGLHTHQYACRLRKDLLIYVFIGLKVSYILNFVLEHKTLNSNKRTKLGGRMRWSEAEKKLVIKHFRQHINKKVVPKKHECEELIAKNKNLLLNKDWVRVKTFIYNTFRTK